MGGWDEEGRVRTEGREKRDGEEWKRTGGRREAVGSEEVDEVGRSEIHVNVSVLKQVREGGRGQTRKRGESRRVEGKGTRDWDGLEVEKNGEECSTSEVITLECDEQRV